MVTHAEGLPGGGLARYRRASRIGHGRHAVDALRPGGTLLVVGHDLLNLTEGWGGPTRPDVLFTPDDIAAEVGDLQVEKAERVRRPVEDDGVLHEAIDALVRARRP
jgi:hypothetical protein